MVFCVRSSYNALTFMQMGGLYFFRQSVGSYVKMLYFCKLKFRYSNYGKEE